MKKIIFVMFIITTVIFVGLYLKEKISFPVTYKICGLGYVDCQEIARFKDRESCETTNKKWGWYCDETDKNNIICKDKESNIATGFCD